MHRTGAALMAAGLVVMTLPASAQVSLFPIPRDALPSLSFSWSGPLDGATEALAERLGYKAWTTMASGLPIPRPWQADAPPLTAPPLFVAQDAAAAARAARTRTTQQRLRRRRPPRPPRRP